MIMMHTSQQSRKDGLNEEHEEDFRSRKSIIRGNIFEHPTGTLTRNLHKTAGEENMYVWCGSGRQKICNHTRELFFGSTSADPTNANKQVVNKRRKDDN